MADSSTPSTDAPSPDAPSADAISELILRIFRVNGGLLLAGDRLVSPLGLTSARWQLLGGIFGAKQPQPVVQLARDIGVSRQAVQRLANELAGEGIVAFCPNPQHKRAQLVVLTARGQELYEAALDLQRPWAEKLGKRLNAAQAAIACDVVDGLLTELDALRKAADV